jgi:hypothetical protein
MPFSITGDCGDLASAFANDFWLMSFVRPGQPWGHVTPIPGHPLGADLDCTNLNFAARSAVAGDFDGDGRDELAVAPSVRGSGGNDFWVMDFDHSTGTWRHLSPIPGHGMDADFDCSGTDVAARFAVCGDFDGDGRAEIAIAPWRSGTEGNDFWAMEFEPGIGWRHMSPQGGHPFNADFDCSGEDVAAHFAVAGNVYKGAPDELAICIEAGMRTSIDIRFRSLESTITDDELRNCIRDRYENASINCEACADDASMLGYDNQWRFLWWQGSSTIALCASHIRRVNIGEVAMHEWAHSCGWNHGDGKGVPGNDGTQSN